VILDELMPSDASERYQVAIYELRLGKQLSEKNRGTEQWMNKLHLGISQVEENIDVTQNSQM
jgi:hypothetical protein